MVEPGQGPVAPADVAGATGLARGRRTTEIRRRLMRLLWVAPAALVTLAFLIVPIVMILVLSVRPGQSFEMASIYGGLSLEHYRAVLASSDLLPTLATTALYVAGVVIPSTLLGAWVALMVDRVFRGRGIVQALLLAPWAVPGVVVSVAYSWMLNESFGVVNALLLDLRLVHEPIGWLTSVEWALAGVVMPTVWKTFPFVAITLIAALRGIPDHLYEAAEVDGATGRQVLRHITLPAVRSALALVLVMTSLLAFKEFDFIYALTQGGPAGATETMAIRVYNESFRNFRLERASAWGVATLVVGAGIVAAGMRWLRDEYL